MQRFNDLNRRLDSIPVADSSVSRMGTLAVTDRDNLTLRARLFSGWFLKFFPASAVG